MLPHGWTCTTPRERLPSPQGTPNSLGLLWRLSTLSAEEALLCGNNTIEFAAAITTSSAGLDLKSRLQQGVGGVSHFQLVSVSLDMKNHRGVCPPSWH